jgi:hypothetical protein
MRYAALAEILVAALLVVLVPSDAICGEWSKRPGANLAAGIEQDGADFVVMCDQKAGRALHPDSRHCLRSEGVCDTGCDRKL